MKPRRYYTPTEERAWRSTFTRGNYEGERKLAYDLRHLGPTKLVQAQKKASEERGRVQLANRADEIYREAKQDQRALQVALGEAEPKAPAGLKSRTIYTNTGEKISETYDGLGNLVSVESVFL